MKVTDNILETREKDIQKLFVRMKPMKLLVCLSKGPKYATIISKEIDCTYSYTAKLLKDFKHFGFITYKKQGRIKIILLTEVGKELARVANELLVKLYRVSDE